MKTTRICPTVTAGALAFLCLLSGVGHASGDAGEGRRQGSLSGRVVDRGSEQPVPGASVHVAGLDQVVTTNARGEFALARVPAGSYDLVVEAERYRASEVRRVEVRDGEVASVVVRLDVDPLRIDEQVTVVGQLPRRSDSQPASAFTLTGTQLTTIAGTMGDFGRTLRTIPAAAGLSDERNTVVARGGNPIENGFFIDNMEVPNLSHLPDFGSTGGLYSIVDPSAVSSFDFIVGGFPATFGGFLSSITDIAYREGSRDGVHGQARFDLAMAAAALEGPLPGQRGSWRVSVRHADFTYLKDVIELNNQNPRWTDAHVKGVYDVSQRHSLSFLDVFSSDRSVLVNGGGGGDESSRIDQNTAGVNWRASWSDTLRSETTASYSRYTRERGLEYQPPEDAYNWADRRTTEWFAVRNENARSIGSTGLLQFGLQVRRSSHRVSYLEVPTRPGVILVSTGPWEYRTSDAGAFVSGTVRPLARLRAVAGVRVDHSTASGRTHVSPNVSASFRLHDSWQLNGAFAIVHQGLPADFLAINPALIAARDMRADQFSIGLSHARPSGWRATVEVFDKKYSALPLDVAATHRLVLDREPFRDYSVPIGLVDTGTGRARGVEVMVERRAGRQFSAVVAVRASRDTYRNPNGVERHRLYESRYGISVAADWTPTDRWSVSSTLAVQDGTPYTPTNAEASLALGMWVRDGTQYNAVRYPTYATLNARVERRFKLGRVDLAVYADIWNLLDRENIYPITGWSPTTGDIFEVQMPRTPFVGVGIIF
jgi:hypothetical protein